MSFFFRRVSLLSPGLSHYAPNPPDVRASIKDLLNFIKETVPKDQWQQTPIHLHVSGARTESVQHE